MDTPRALIKPEWADRFEEKRCWQCNRVLAVSYGFRGRVEIICRRCRSKNVLRGEEDACPGQSAST